MGQTQTRAFIPPRASKWLWPRTARGYLPQKKVCIEVVITVGDLPKHYIYIHTNSVYTSIIITTVYSIYIYTILLIHTNSVYLHVLLLWFLYDPFKKIAILMIFIHLRSAFGNPIISGRLDDPCLTEPPRWWPDGRCPVAEASRDVAIFWIAMFCSKWHIYQMYN